jgi:IS5 family transposase
MIGKQKSQFSLLDGVFNRRTKKGRTDALLRKIDQFVDFRPFERMCEPMYKPSKRGNPSTPIIVSLKCLILQYLYDLSDPALEDALIDRLSFQRFAGITFDTDIPDYSTIWRFRDRLIKAGLLDTIFAEVLRQIDEKGLVLRRGTIVDATLVKAARKKRKLDNDAPKSPQRDSDATATKRGKKGYFGYKGHIGVDQGSGIIRRVRFTTASAHDATERANLLSGDERAVFGDKGYADDTLKRECRRTGTYYGVLDKGRRGRPLLSSRQKKRNRQKNRIRAAVERPFAHFKHLMGYVHVRYVNLARNALHFSFLCMIENIRTALALTSAKG